LLSDDAVALGFWVFLARFLDVACALALRLVGVGSVLWGVACGVRVDVFVDVFVAGGACASRSGSEAVSSSSTAGVDRAPGREKNPPGRLLLGSPSDSAWAAPPHNSNASGKEISTASHNANPDVNFDAIPVLDFVQIECFITCPRKRFERRYQ
jgi:hypothetical protein